MTGSEQQAEERRERWAPERLIKQGEKEGGARRLRDLGDSEATSLVRTLCVSELPGRIGQGRLGRAAATSEPQTSVG